MTLLVKNRRPSRLFSWISQIARRASDATSINTTNNVVEQCPSSNIVPARRSTTICCERTPSASPSDTLSTASSIHPKECLNDDNNNDISHHHTRSRSCNENRAKQHQPFYANSENEQDDDDDSDGSTIIGTTPRRPASVFSLPTTSSHPYNANRHSSDPAPPRLRLSCDLELMRLTPPPPSTSSRQHSGWPRADRMIIRHELIRLALNGLYYSPVDLTDGCRILHVGCGDGSWCIDMAKKHKKCTVIGIDDHDVIDRNKTLPDNFEFMLANKNLLHALRQLPDGTFDFIFARFLIFSCTPDLYREMIQECWRLCKRQGFVEMMELDMQMYGNPVVGPLTQMLNTQVIRRMQQRGSDPHFARHLQDFFFFHELVEQMHQGHGDAYHAKYTSLPLGVWGGRIGVMFRDDLHDLIEAVHANDGDSCYDPWTDQRLEAMLDKVDEELETHWAFMNLHHAYAQRM
ncbi:hypothetical protein LRAMOSA09410 [Lichtheimia ramosa]|uniref:Methyltransferase domain-containing protein n=1 Tax=Lichtheimia ramosa TaxID=688394 RepID=A0A077WGU5_9FUNG|nr:hypothetical protein LRAMOSA09410 [Lichtheimia ramosa]